MFGYPQNFKPLKITTLTVSLLKLLDSYCIRGNIARIIIVQNTLWQIKYWRISHTCIQSSYTYLCKNNIGGLNIGDFCQSPKIYSSPIFHLIWVYSYVCISDIFIAWNARTTTYHVRIYLYQLFPLSIKINGATTVAMPQTNEKLCSSYARTHTLLKIKNTLNLSIYNYVESKSKLGLRRKPVCR